MRLPRGDCETSEFSRIPLPRLYCAVVVLLAACCASTSFAAEFLVQDGQPRAEIVIAAKPARMARLAAEELQAYVQKISGARLPIVTDPTGGAAVQVYVGQSPHTDRLKIDAAGLKHGAFHMVSGPSHLVLLGHDSDFSPPELFLTTPADLPQFMKIWDKATGEHWGFANGNLYKEFNGSLKIWARDDRGSLNAVYEFLRMQGVRWYLPGDLGEVVPTRATIPLPDINRTVRADFALRFPFQNGRMFAHAAGTREEILWQLRLGWNQGPDIIGDFGMGLSHGMRAVLERPEVRSAHPEYYTLFNGKRDDLVIGESRGCLSSEGLFQQNVKYVRAMYDLLDAPMVSLMPEDGYVNLCQCKLCEGKGTLDRGWNGQISDYVWDYVNRVAKEVYKTHPDRKVSCFAYGGYLLPPLNIDMFSPNVVVGICQNRNSFHDPAARQKVLELRQGWLARMPEGHKQLVNYDYYLHLRPDVVPHMPIFLPRAIAADLQSLKGISIGDFIEVYRDPGGMNSLAVDHLNLYVTSRCWWDADLEIDKLLDEYCRDFYGPASREMKALIDYSEANLSDLPGNPAKIGKALELLAEAQGKVVADSIYGQRMAFVAGYLQPMHALREQLAIGRQNVPEAAAFARKKSEIRLDGQLDDKFWEGNWAYDLQELQTGKPPYMSTSFRMGWTDDAIYFGVRCNERDTSSLSIGTTKNEDGNIWNGDCIEILLETQTHAYYQIAVNPAGAIIDLDRRGGLDTLWSSGAEVATHVGDGYWSAEVRIPVVGAEESQLNPRFAVAGRLPTRNYPWYFNVCRQRFRPTGKEYSAFSPTGETTFHVVKKFGKLHVR